MKILQKRRQMWHFYWSTVGFCVISLIIHFSSSSGILGRTLNYEKRAAIVYYSTIFKSWILHLRLAWHVLILYVHILFVTEQNIEILYLCWSFMKQRSYKRWLNKRIYKMEMKFWAVLGSHSCRGKIRYKVGSIDV